MTKNVERDRILMNEAKTALPKSNGYGSFNFYLLIWIEAAHAKALHEKGWECVEEDIDRSIFKYHFRNRRRGDDETAVFELWGDLPKGFEDWEWGILWDRSNY